MDAVNANPFQVTTPLVVPARTFLPMLLYPPPVRLS